MIQLTRIFLLLILYSTGASAASSVPNVVVSIKPFYNICANVMQSVGKPHLLLTQNASPHDYQLKPSDAKLINSSDLLIWGGPGLEGYLNKAAINLANKQLDLASAPGLELLAMRFSTQWHHHDHGHSHHDDIDPHFWLDPDNSIIIASAIASKLAEIDPQNATIYADNAREFSKQINTQKLIWQKQLNPYKTSPYIVSHDAYQYFNNYFGLDGVGAITLNPEIPPSIQRIQNIHNLLQKEQVTCIFTEPQFTYKVVNTLVNDTSVHTGVLDPLGQDKDLGPDGYFILIDNLIAEFVKCNAT